MALKAINDKAAAFGAAIKDLVTTHVALANRIVAPTAKLPTLLVAHGLSGGALPDTAEARAHVQAILDAVPVPTDSELDAAGASLLDAADRASVRAAIRGEAALRYVAGYCRDRMPANDV